MTAQDRLKNTKIELKAMDLVIGGLLLASCYQLAVSFGGHWNGWIKAIMFEAAIGIFARNVSRAKVMQESAKMIWFVLVSIMFISILANLNYEWLKYTTDGRIQMSTLWKLDFLQHTLAFAYSGGLPLIVLGVTTGRALTAKNCAQLEKEAKKEAEKESKAVKMREYQREYYHKKKAEQQDDVVKFTEKEGKPVAVS